MGPSNFRLMDLPAELRSMIIAEVLVYAPTYDIQVLYKKPEKWLTTPLRREVEHYDDHHFLRHDKLTPPLYDGMYKRPQTAVLLVSRAFYSECAPLFYGANTFIFRNLGHLRDAFLDRMRPETALLIRSIRLFDPKNFYRPDFFELDMPDAEDCWSPTPQQWLTLRNVTRFELVTRFSTWDDIKTHRDALIKCASLAIEKQLCGVVSRLAWVHADVEKPTPFVRCERPIYMQPRAMYEQWCRQRDTPISEHPIRCRRLSVNLLARKSSTYTTGVRSSLWSAAAACYAAGSDDDKTKRRVEFLDLQDKLHDAIAANLTMSDGEEVRWVDFFVLEARPAWTAADEMAWDRRDKCWLDRKVF